MRIHNILDIFRFNFNNNMFQLLRTGVGWCRVISSRMKMGETRSGCRFTVITGRRIITSFGDGVAVAHISGGGWKFMIMR